MKHGILDLNPPRRHVDPSPTGAPFTPRPVSSDANPGMSVKVGDNVLPAKEGGQYQFRHPGGDWKHLGEAGQAIELRVVSAKSVTTKRPTSAEFLAKLGE